MMAEGASSIATTTATCASPAAVAPSACDGSTPSAPIAPITSPITAPPSPEDAAAAAYMDECDMVTEDYGASILGCGGLSGHYDDDGGGDGNGGALGSFDTVAALFDDVICHTEWQSAFDLELCGL